MFVMFVNTFSIAYKCHEHTAVTRQAHEGKARSQVIEINDDDDTKNMVLSHYHQQASEFLSLTDGEVIRNAMEMTGFDIATSTSLNNNVEKKNSLQKTVRSFSGF